MAIIYKTIICDPAIRCVNDLHKAVHNIMHGNNHKDLPPFLPVGDNTVIVQSSYKPVGEALAVTECSVNPGQVKLRVRIAAIKRVRIDGKTVEKVTDVSTSEGVAHIRQYVVNRFGDFGVTPAGELNTISVKRAGCLSDPTHGIRSTPVCDIEGVWNAEDADKLAELLCHRIGRIKFLGLGMVRLVTSC